jgi:hypothetical protein
VFFQFINFLDTLCFGYQREKVWILIFFFFLVLSSFFGFWIFELFVSVFFFFFLQFMCFG